MNNNINRVFLIILITIFLLPATVLFGLDEDAVSESDEYLAFEIEFSLTLQQKYKMLDGQKEAEIIYDHSNAILDYRNKNFSFFIDGSLIGDRIYDPSEEYMFGRYIYMNDAYVSYETDLFSVKAGRSTQEDVIDSPYTLFVNSEPIPSMQLETKFTGDYFFYTNRWVQLNHNSNQIYFGSDEDSIYWDEVNGATGVAYSTLYPDGIYWLDRGSNFKVYGLNIGDWRFGLQEGAVYLYDSFNPEFFISPMIMYFTQLVIDDGAKPWTTMGNSKHVMGFFVDRKTNDSYISSQILVDDINASIIPGIDVENQNRLAWSFGGYRNFDFGRLGFYHAGATKDTFGATTSHDRDKLIENYGAERLPLYYSSRPYPYTYYPAVSYELEDGTVMPIDYTKNNIGYKYGENNLAFMIDYQNSFLRKTPGEFSLYTSFEWVLNGSKSPANPWHEYDSFKDIVDPTALLDGTVEHILLLSGRVDKPVTLFAVPFSLFADFEAGVAINAMNLEPASTEDDRELTEAWIYRPQEGVNEPILSFRLGASYLWRVK